MSRVRSTAAEMAFQHLAQTERVVRCEAERRECKSRLRILDAMAEELDDQLIYVAQFKKQWLDHRQQLEEERQRMSHDERNDRSSLEAEYVKEINRLIQLLHPTVVATRS